MTQNSSLASPLVAVGDTSLAAQARLLKAAGEPLRLAVLQVLRHNAFGVLELCDILDTKQSGMSHHLKVLATAGLVSTRREGNSIFYRRAPVNAQNPQHQLCHAIYQAVDAQPLDAEIAHRLQQVHQQRAQQSQDFFTRHAGQFRSQQEKIARFSLYSEMAKELIVQARQPGHRHCLEIGPGEGSFLPFLTEQFPEVTALDTSADLLSLARSLAQQHGLEQVQFVHGDSQTLLDESRQFHCIVANMVLHHVSNPAALVADISQLLAPGGFFVLTELCQHDQDWAKTACGDLWLGFDPDDLIHWADIAGLNPGEQQIAGLRNGFQMMAQSFYKPEGRSSS